MVRRNGLGRPIRLRRGLGALGDPDLEEGEWDVLVPSDSDSVTVVAVTVDSVTVVASSLTLVPVELDPTFAVAPPDF